MPSTTLQIVDSTDALLFDLNDPTGLNNAGAGASVKTYFAAGGGFNLGAPPAEKTVIASASRHGGTVVYRRDPLVESSWATRLKSTDRDSFATGLGYLGSLLAAGGALKWTPPNSTQARYIDFEPSDSLASYIGRDLELYRVERLFEIEVPVKILRQPYLRGLALDPAVNKLTNSTLLWAASGRPALWAWDNTAQITSEQISATYEGYQFVISSANQRNLQQSTAAATAAPGDVWTASFDAACVAGADANVKARAAVDFMSSLNAVLATANGTLTTLTSAFQRLVVTTAAAPASTDHIQVRLNMNNSAATAYTVVFRRAQLEKAAAATDYRCGVESVAYDPAAAASMPRIMPVYCRGNAPSLAKLKVTADAQGLGALRVHRTSVSAVTSLNQNKLIQLESATLGTGTASVANASASAGNCAETTYSAATPAVRATPTAAGGTGQTIALAKPTGAVSGDVLVAFILRLDDTTLLASPAGWQLVRNDANTVNTFTQKFRVFSYVKVLTSSDDATSTFTWSVVSDAAGARSWVGVIQACTGVDNNTPVDVHAGQAGANSISVTAPTISTTAANALVLFCAAGLNSAGTLTFTPPAGTTPTFTENADQQADVTFRALETANGVLATAGATGAKTATASIAIDSIGVQIALRQAPAPLATRVTAAFAAGFAAGTYEVWCRLTPTAASKQRIRMEWAPMASPATYYKAPDIILDVSAATVFNFSEILLGTLYLSADYANTGLTIRLSSGLEASASSKLDWDFLWLAPADERVGTITAPTLLAASEQMISDASVARLFHLDSAGKLVEALAVSGATPLELMPGTDLLSFEAWQDQATGWPARQSKLTAVLTVAVTHTPYYRA